MAPVTLAQAKLNTTDDLDLTIIDEFRKESAILDRLSFDPVVSPVGGGATLTYTYTRLLAERGANFRAVNTEYVDQAATRTRASVDLVPLGGSFSIDRIVAALGPSATSELTLQVQQLVKGVRAKFQDSVINGTGDGDFADGGGGTAPNYLGFEGLDSILAGSGQEFGASETTVAADKDWTAVDSQLKAFSAMEVLDELIAAVDGRPDVIMANKRAILRLKQIGRYAGYYSQTEDAFGRLVDRFDGIQLIDLGQGAGPSAVDIIPIESRDLDGAGSGTATALTDIYAVRFGMDSFHAVSCLGAPLIRTWMPDFSTEGAVKRGEAEMGPVAVVLKATKGAAVLRNVKVS
jgi:hypothetical protein